MTRRGRPLLAVLFVTLSGLGFTLTAAAANPTAATVVKTITPLDANGALKAGYRVSRHVGDGTCQAGSYQTGTAYRCSSPAVATNVLDPCWPLATTPSTMVCQAKPWARTVIELEVNGTAAGGPTPQQAQAPWGVLVGAHIRCLRDVGAVLRIDGELLSYHCSHHRDLFGALRTFGATWRAHLYRTNARTATGEKPIGWRVVTLAWRGAPLPTPTPTASPSASPSATDAPTGAPTGSPGATSTSTSSG